MKTPLLFLSLLLAVAAGSPRLRAQVTESVPPPAVQDSLTTEAPDTEIAYANIFVRLAQEGPYRNRVVLEQPEALTQAVTRLAQQNIHNPNKLQGYRIRIYFDNGQNARSQSEQTMEQFRAAWPGVPVYRAYANPYFKVTVGDFRTKSEAMRFMAQLLPAYPRAFLTREPIAWPQN